VATKAERTSEDIKKAEYMQDKIGSEYEGIISSITSFGIFVQLENTVEGLIKFENMGEIIPINSIVPQVKNKNAIVSSA